MRSSFSASVSVANIDIFNYLDLQRLLFYRVRSISTEFRSDIVQV